MQRLQKRMLSFVNLYCNTTCNSKCRICSFWKMKPVELLDVSEIQTVVDSQFVDDHTWFGLQGGEFILHPQADEIMKIFRQRQRNYVLFTNLLDFEGVKHIVARHEVPYVTVSLDGNREGYARARGVDGFEAVTRGVVALSKMTSVAVGITLSAWSRYRDYQTVAGFCREHDIEFGVNIYTDSYIYRANEPKPDIDFLDRITADCGDTFCQGYQQWQAGSLSLPCQSIREVASISPNGAVLLCHNQPIELGSIKKQPFDYVWGSQRAVRLHEEYYSCNACWTSCYRSYDLERCESWTRGTRST